MSKNLFETYNVNGRNYTDNLGINAMISIPKKQYIEYEQQKEEIKRLNNIINEIEKYIISQMQEQETLKETKSPTYIFCKLQELKGSDK